MRDFTSRKKAGLLTPEEQAKDEKQRERINGYNKKQWAKRKAEQPPKPLTTHAILKRHYAGLPLTDEEYAKYRAWQDKKNEQAKARLVKKKAETPPKPPRILQKDVVEKVKAGGELTAEEQAIYDDYVEKRKVTDKRNNEKKKLNPDFKEYQREYNREYKQRKKVEKSA